MKTVQISLDRTRELWQRQKGMCALTGKKFENETDASDRIYLQLDESGEPAGDNIVMVWKSADELAELESGVRKARKYNFPYAGFSEYSEEERLRDARELTESALQKAESMDRYNDARTLLREAQQTVGSLAPRGEANDELRDALNAGLDKINQKQNEEKDKFERESAENYDQLVGKINEAIETARSMESFKEARQTLMNAQALYKDATLARKRRDEFNAIIQKALEELNERQRADRENYEMECIENYHAMKAKIEEGVRAAEAATNYGKARERLIALQGEIKSLKLMPGNREELYQIIRTAFEGINERQSKERKEFDKETTDNYEKIKVVVDEAIDFAQKSPMYKDAREALIAAQGQIKGLRLRNEHRDELYGRIRAVFEDLNRRQTAEKEGFEQETSENYARLLARIEEIHESISDKSEFKIIRDNLIAVQSEVKIAKLKREQRNELFAKLRRSFAKFDEVKDNYFANRREMKKNKLGGIKETLESKLARLEESLSRDRDSLAFQLGKLDQVREGEKQEEIKAEIQAKIAEIEARLREKQEKIAETIKRLEDIDAEIIREEQEANAPRAENAPEGAAPEAAENVEATNAGELGNMPDETTEKDANDESKE